MAATTTAVPEQPQQISSFGRVFGVLFSPGKTYEDIVRRPTWVVPMLLLTILSIGVGAMLAQKMDWRAYLRKQDAKMSNWDQMPDAQKETMLDVQVKWTQPITWVVSVAGPIIVALLLALIYWGAFNVMSGAQLRFATPFSIVSYAFVPAILSSILLLVVLAMKRYGDVDPQRMIATNVGAMLPADAAPWLVSLGTSLDIFWIWSMILMVIGFPKANPKKISKGTAFAVIIGLWLLWVVVKVGWAAMAGAKTS